MYSTFDDIKKLIPEETIIQLTDDENLGSVNQSRIDEAIAQADSEIDSYCGGRYTVPLGGTAPGEIVPDIVKKISVDIAIYNLYSRRVEVIPETRAERYKNAVRQLEGIAKGTVSIGEAAAPPATTAEGGVEGNRTDEDRIFTKETLNGY
jgi:phage gp36-like protein